MKKQSNPHGAEVFVCYSCTFKGTRQQLDHHGTYTGHIIDAPNPLGGSRIPVEHLELPGLDGLVAAMGRTGGDCDDAPQLKAAARQVDGILELLTSARTKVQASADQVRSVGSALVAAHGVGIPVRVAVNCPAPIAALSEAGDLVSGVVMATENVSPQLAGILTAIVLDLEEHSLAVKGAQGLTHECGRLHLVGAALTHSADRLGIVALALTGAVAEVRECLTRAGGVRGGVGHA